MIKGGHVYHIQYHKHIPALKNLVKRTTRRKKRRIIDHHHHHHQTVWYTRVWIHNMRYMTDIDYSSLFVLHRGRWRWWWWWIVAVGEDCKVCNKRSCTLVLEWFLIFIICKNKTWKGVCKIKVLNESDVNQTSTLLNVIVHLINVDDFLLSLDTFNFAQLIRAGFLIKWRS